MKKLISLFVLLAALVLGLTVSKASFAEVTASPSPTSGIVAEATDKDGNAVTATIGTVSQADRDALNNKDVVKDALTKAAKANKIKYSDDAFVLTDVVEVTVPDGTAFPVTITFTGLNCEDGKTFVAHKLGNGEWELIEATVAGGKATVEFNELCPIGFYAIGPDAEAISFPYWILILVAIVIVIVIIALTGKKDKEESNAAAPAETAEVQEVAEVAEVDQEDTALNEAPVEIAEEETQVEEVNEEVAQDEEVTAAAAPAEEAPVEEVVAEEVVAEEVVAEETAATPEETTNNEVAAEEVAATPAEEVAPEANTAPEVAATPATDNAEQSDADSQKLFENVDDLFNDILGE